DGRAAARTKQDGEESRRQAGALRRPHRGRDAERARRSLVRDELAGGETLEGAQLPAEDRRGALDRDTKVSDLTQAWHDCRAAVKGSQGSVIERMTRSEPEQDARHQYPE